MSRTYLKMKIKSLASESKIIRSEERKWKKRKQDDGQPPEIYFGLHQHRVVVVRKETRTALLAYGFMRGRAYRTLESKCREKPDKARVAELVQRYNPPESWHNLKSNQRADKITEWIDMVVDQSHARHV